MIETLVSCMDTYLLAWRDCEMNGSDIKKKQLVLKTDGRYSKEGVLLF